MRASALLLLLCLPAAHAAAGVYYINKGVQYHIGDNRYDMSEDASFVGTYPVVGQEWIQAFKVDRPDTVRVDIELVRGVDNCPYCKVLVSIDDWDMGRLSQENNREPFTTLEPLAKKVEPGRVHLLKIASYGSERVDDFVIADVVVRSQLANVTLLNPGPVLKAPEAPMPEFFDPAPAPRGPCQGLAPQRNWLHGFSEGQPTPFKIGPAGDGFSQPGAFAQLDPGQEREFTLRLSAPPASGDRVGQPLEILLGVEKPSGWALLFAPGRERLLHANLIKRGRYAAASFSPAWNPGALNRARVAYCGDGSARLYLNGVQAGPALDRLSGPLALRVRGLGLEAEVGGAPPGLEAP